MKRPSSRFFRFGSAILALGLVAVGCRIQSPIQEGQKVSMDPCKLVGLAKAQSIMGAPMYQQLSVSYDENGQTSFDQCFYHPSGSHEWSELQVFVSGMTRSKIGGTSLPKSLRKLGAGGAL